MTIDEFVSHMRSLDVKLWAEDGRLRYSAPQGVLTEELLGQLAARKQEVIAFLRSSEQSPGTNGQPLAPAPRDGELPLSFAQERLWLFDQLGLNRSVYNITVGYRVEGRLDVSALRRCLEEIVRRHEALRTVFDSQGGRAVQVILPELRPSFAEVDLSADPEGRGGARFRQLAAAEAERPFDLTRGPLLRATLVRTGGQEHVLLLTMHHIVSDGWSMGIFERELVTLYECYSTGKPSPLKELPVQYADFAVWERRRLAVGQLEGQLSYWKERLGGDLPVLDLPTDHTRPAVQLFEGANYSFDIPKSLTEDLKSLGREQGATLFMTLLAGWQALLSRYSNQQDICVGTPIAGRTRVETEGLIGFFVNTLVLRTDLSGEPSFRELLGRVREVCLGAFAHQDVPFEKLVEEVARERSLSRTPLFQVMFALQNTPREARLAGGLVLQPQSFATGRAKFDLTLVAHESDGGLRVTLNYRTDLFDAETIGRMAGHYERLLEAAARNPDEAVSRAELLDAKERRQLVVGWSHTRLGQMPERSVAELFEARAAERPEAAALVYEGGEVSYGELDERANRLAHLLRQRGVGPESRVGVLLPRTPDVIVALLAILKAGGAYVPLDPHYPEERLRFMLEDSDVRLLLTEESLLEALPGLGERALCLDREREAVSRCADDNLGRTAEPDNLAYVMYTSGSTGVPKGVCVTHRGVVRLVVDNPYARFGADEVFLHMAPLSFDASTFEIWGALLHGGRLALMPPGVPSTEEVARAVRGYGVTTLWLTAGLFQQMVDERPEGLSAVRQLLAGGDVLSVPHVRKHLEAMPEGHSLINGYGPTESTTFACTYAMRAREEFEHSVPIGRPVARTGAYILDRHMRPVPVGVVGELHLGGEGLARGYLGRPGLSAEKFVPHPLSSEPGARLYRTGDLARYLPSGDIEFRGRTDAQVKLRGFRIEPGEIEAALAAHASVREAAVVVREDGPGEKRLVAYVVTADGGRDGAPSELRSYLKERLPAYMVPSTFVTLEALPLSANGKVERRLLPAPERGRQGSGHDYVAPRTATEEMLSDIWAELLGVEPIGVNEDFFELGGHSLLAMRVVSRIQTLLGVRVGLRHLFECPTVAALASAVEEERRASEGLSLPPLKPAPRAGELPLSFSQQRLWFLHVLDPQSAAYNIPLALRLRGRLDVPVLGESLREIVRRHEVLRTSYAQAGGRPLQVIRESAEVDLQVVDLSGVAEGERGAEALRLAGEEAQRSFDLTRDPVLRAVLFKLGADEHILALTIHHMAADGWSLGVLLKELAALYEAFGRGAASPLPELPVQYADYAAWQREWMSGEVLEAQLGYWRRQLGGSLPLLELPTDRPRPAVQTFRGGRCALQIPAGVVRGLKSLGREEGATLFMTLLAGWQTLLSRYSNQQDVCVGTPVAGRTRVETEGLIGFFVNTLVLRTDLSGGPSFRELVGRVREACLGAYAHQEVPFEKLVEELQPERSLSRTPLFQVMFSLQNVPRDEPALGDLSVSPVRLENTTAKFDLTLGLTDTGDGLSGAVEYNADLFDAETIERLAESFGVLLEAISVDPDGRVSELPLLTPARLHQQLSEWNETAQEYPTGSCLHELFEQRAAENPWTAALFYEGWEVSYGELNWRANRLAHLLRQRGVGPESRVGVLLPRTPELVISLLAILKAGGAYVPLDPRYPQERLRFMLEDSGAALVLTEGPLLESLPGLGERALCLDAEREAVGQCPGENPSRLAVPESLAYVIYTSGSTGRPKGVAIAHRNAVALVSWARSRYTAEELSGVLASTSVCFDLSVFELFAPLSWGGAAVLADDALALCGLKSAARVRLVNTVPSAATELLRLGCLPASAKTVNLAGEPLATSLVRRLYEEAGAAKVYDLYGPTEDTTYSTCALREAEGAATVGRPLANRRAYILDAGMRPVPVGVEGEVYLGGAGVTRGYLNRPAQTAERYVPDPFSTEPGGRLYRTGDLARYLNDGRIIYVGRRDRQVKVRGFRIELGEIEAALNAHPQVSEAVVVVRESTPGDQRLTAYVVGESGAGGPQLDLGALREHLRRLLPEYMVPSAFVPLEALPMTPNGKVDRRALPEPGLVGVEPGKGYVAPRTTVEQLMVEVWAEVLRVVRVGVHDNFFDLGGHSLLATQLVSRLASAFSVELPIRSLFESPTPAALSAAVEALLGDGRASEVAPLVRVGRGAELPLSFAQQRLWFLDQLEPGGAAYNMYAALRLGGRLDAGALGGALNEVVRRHEALRATFVVSDGRPVQVIGDTYEVSLEAVDLRREGGAEDEALAEGRRQAAAEAREPFDLRRGPLLRAKLWRVSDEDHLLLITMHHIVSDGWSLGVLTRELSALYAAFRAGRPSPLPDLPIQYADYAVWQREHLLGGVLDAQLSYWRRQLAGAPPELELPTDRPRPAVPTHRGGRHRFTLSKEATEGLRRLSRDEGATIFMTLLAGWQTLLSRYSGQQDICVGTPVAGRTRVETEPLIGFFINTLVLRTDLSGDPSFRELLGRVREICLGAYANQEVPFEKLVEELQPERSLSRTPLFQVMFILNNISREEMLGDLSMSPVRLENATAKFDLTLGLMDTADGLSGAIEYNADLFDVETIERLAESFGVLLGAISADPEQRVSDLPLLTESRLRQPLSEWNETVQEYPSESCLHELFEARAAESPAAPALFHEGGEVSYGELDERANRLAHLLRQRGVGPESRVGVLLPRTPELVISLLAILKAGGAYVPLDPRYPQERLRFMLEDSGADIILTEGSLLESLPGLGGRALCLDTQREEAAGYACDNPVRTTEPDNLAYVIYTSGSTGRPKGVAIAHRNAVALVSWARSRYTAEELSGVLASTSVCFDLSVFELFAPLSWGGAAVLADDALALCGLKSAARVRLVNTVPSAATELLRLGCLPASAKTVNLAGEPLATSLVRRLYEEAGVGKVYDLYGPTEDTTYSTCALREPDGAATVGRPLSNRRAYILDALMRPVPVGVEGEVYLGGAGVTRGYLNRPAQTAERYVPDPFSTEPGGRLYRTGDVARYLNDGRIVYVGRRDRQVKVRGFRIELGEIENVLSKHPAVREGVVAAWDDGDGKKRLAAYVVSNGGGRPSAAELREHLRASLPEYMVPSSFTPLEALPLTPNGKVDRRRLPAPEPAHAETEDAYVEPRTAVEEVVAGIWKHVLKVERVGVRDNFFDLGGHSLLATSVVSRVAESLRVNVPLRSMFEAPTVEQFCRAVVEREAKPGQTEKIADILKRVQSMEGAAVLEALRER